MKTDRKDYDLTSSRINKFWLLAYKYEIINLNWTYLKRVFMSLRWNSNLAI